MVPALRSGVSPVLPAAADSLLFSTGVPDGKIAIASRPESGGKFEIESANDFVLTRTTSITSAMFTGLMTGATIRDIGEIRVGLYRVLPVDSDVGRTSGAPTFSTPNVPARINSPADVEFADRDTASNNLSFPTDDRGDRSRILARHLAKENQGRVKEILRSGQSVVAAHLTLSWESGPAEVRHPP
jgi:hypothetical protein